MLYASELLAAACLVELCMALPAIGGVLMMGGRVLE